MKAIIWTKDNCSFCTSAKALLEANNIEYEEKHIGNGYTKEQLLEVVPNARTVPQIFIDEALIGGYVELQQYLGKNDN